MVAGLQSSDIGARRQQNAKNERQKKIKKETEQGVVVNSIVKDSINRNQNDLLRDYIIPSNSKVPEDVQPSRKDISYDKPLLKLCAGTLGLLGAITGITALGAKIAKKQFQKPSWDSLPDIGRNMNMNNESHFVTYMMVQSPQTKTLVGAAAFFVFAVTGFVLKNFVDGYKDIWVRKQAAKADYKLQDDLIDVETRVFKGKNEIIRTMMQDTAKELHETIEKTAPKTTQQTTTFKGNAPEGNNKSPKKDWLPVLLTAGTIAGTLLLSWVAFKNVQKTGKLIEESEADMHKKVGEILQKTPDEILEKHKNTLKDIFSVMHFRESDVKDKLKRAKLPAKEIQDIVSSVKKRTKKFTQAPVEMGGHPGKVQYFTYIDDARGHFYNWMMNIGSKPLGILAIAISAITGVGYAGEQAINAIREAEVKKANNRTELNLHKNLVNVELRNFKKKKESYINPLIEEFKAQAPNKDHEQLDGMAQNILYEIKNGPPFVYA